MTIFLVALVALFSTALVVMFFKNRRLKVDLALARHLFKSEVVDNLETQTRINELESDLDDSHCVIELLINEQTRELRDAHFCLEMLLREGIAA